MVSFDAADIRSIVERMADQVGFASDVAIDVRVDETVPLGGIRVASTAPVVLEIQGGALEDPKRLRQFHAEGALRVVGRLLFQTSDMLEPAFGTPPARDELDLPERVAWDAYAMGRVARLGHDAQRQRWLYAFRTRHGFSDGVDRGFDLLWSGVGLTWVDVQQISADALASAQGAVV